MNETELLQKELMEQLGVTAERAKELIDDRRKDTLKGLIKGYFGLFEVEYQRHPERFSIEELERIAIGIEEVFGVVRLKKGFIGTEVDNKD